MHVLGLRLLAATCIVLSAGVILNVLFFQEGGARTSRALLGKPLPPAFQQTRTDAEPDDRIGPQGRDAPPALPQPTRQLVRAIQRELGFRGYFPRRPNGRQDVLTRAAILAFETDHGLPLSAHASERVLQSILLGANLAGSGRDAPAGLEAQALIRLVQHLLVKVDAGKVASSGQLDRATKRAIMAFERHRRLRPSGKITADLVVELQRVARKS